MRSDRSKDEECRRGEEFESGGRVCRNQNEKKKKIDYLILVCRLVKVLEVVIKVSGWR